MNNKNIFRTIILCQVVTALGFFLWVIFQDDTSVNVPDITTNSHHVIFGVQTGSLILYLVSFYRLYQFKSSSRALHALSLLACHVSLYVEILLFPEEQVTSIDFFVDLAGTWYSNLSGALIAMAFFTDLKHRFTR